MAGPPSPEAPVERAGPVPAEGGAEVPAHGAPRHEKTLLEHPRLNQADDALRAAPINAGQGGGGGRAAWEREVDWGAAGGRAGDPGAGGVPPMGAGGRAPTTEPYQICSNCGAGMLEPTKFCISCGAPMAAEGPRPATPSEWLRDPAAGPLTAADAAVEPSPYLEPRHIVMAPPPIDAEAEATLGDGPPRRWLWTLLALAALVCAGGGVALALALTSHSHNVAQASASTAGQSTGPGGTVSAPGSGTQPGGANPRPAGSTPTGTAADPQAILNAVNTHWEDIKNHDFVGAYSYLTANAGGDESTWVSSHQADGIQDVSYQFSVGQASGTTATVNVVTLQTHASSDVSSSDPTGCMSFSGSYGMDEQGGRWLIDSANLSQTQC